MIRGGLAARRTCSWRRRSAAAGPSSGGARTAASATVLGRPSPGGSRLGPSHGRGSTVSGFTRRTGRSWTLVGTDTIALSNTVYVGLAVTSHTSTNWRPAVFSSVVARPLSSTSNQPPTVSISVRRTVRRTRRRPSMTITRRGVRQQRDHHAGRLLRGRRSSAATPAVRTASPGATRPPAATR